MIAPLGAATAVVEATAGRVSAAAGLATMPRGFALLSTSTERTAAGTLPSELIFCAAALEPSASMKRPMTADAARPPIKLTTIVFALELAECPARAARQASSSQLQ